MLPLPCRQHCNVTMGHNEVGRALLCVVLHNSIVPKMHLAHLPHFGRKMRDDLVPHAISQPALMTVHLMHCPTFNNQLECNKVERERREERSAEKDVSLVLCTRMHGALFHRSNRREHTQSQKCRNTMGLRRKKSLFGRRWRLFALSQKVYDRLDGKLL